MADSKIQTHLRSFRYWQDRISIHENRTVTWPEKICILTAHTEDSNIFQSMFRRNSVGDMRMYLRKNFEKAAWSEKCR